MNKTKLIIHERFNGTQKMILEKFCKEHDFPVFDVYVDDGSCISSQWHPYF